MDLLGLVAVKPLVMVALSPSTTTSWNLASTTNSKALRQANIFASSLLATGGPLVDSVALIAPILFLMTAPKPDDSVSVNTTALKFSLYIVPEGGHHDYTASRVIWIAS